MKKILMLFAIFILLSNVGNGMSNVTDAGFTSCTVNTSILNIRSGPGTNFSIVKKVAQGTKLKAIGRIYGWYLVQTNDDVFGMVNGWYITPNTAGSTTTNKNIESISSDESTILSLVNKARREAGLNEISFDVEVAKVARIKAKDMVDNNYFSHISPTYGTPFDMLKKFGISYRSAGENIAGHSTATKAFEAWMGSSGHKANILSSNYAYTGIGVVDSVKYGKVFVQMFIGK